MYRRMLGIEPPFPSVGDLFYLLGYGFLLVAMFSFLVGWRASGFPLGNARTQAVVAVAAGLLLAVLNVVMLRPIAHAQLPLAERLLDIGYPILDSIVLVPTLILFGMALHFRGGRVWTVW